MKDFEMIFELAKDFALDGQEGNSTIFLFSRLEKKRA